MSSSSPKNNWAFLPWLAFALFLLIICMLFAGAPGALSFLINTSPFGSFASTVAPAVVGHPTLTAIATAPPGVPAPTLENSKQAYGTFKDDFSNPNIGWSMESNQSYSVGYTTDHIYAITLKAPNQYIFVTPPDNLNPPFKNVSVSAQVKQGNYPGSTYGVICGFQNSSNFYAVEIKDKQYSIVKMVLGQQSAITSPEWKPASNIEYADQLGYVHLTVNCSGSSIGVEINGTHQPVVVDPANTYSGGDVGIFALSGTTVNAGLYDQVLFDSFSMTVKP